LISYSLLKDEKVHRAFLAVALFASGSSSGDIAIYGGLSTFAIFVTVQITAEDSEKRLECEELENLTI